MLRRLLDEGARHQREVSKEGIKRGYQGKVVREDTEDRRERQALADYEGRHDALMNKTVEERLEI